MTTLGADLAASVEATTMVVSAPDADAAELYAVDSETVRVIASDGTAWEIRRGIGSAIAAHSSGATLTPIYPRPAPGGGGGVTVTVPPAAAVAVTNLNIPGASVADGTATLLIQRLIHVPIAFDAANLVTTGALIAAFPEGDWLIDAWMGLNVQFDNGSATSISAILTTDGPNPSTWPSTYGWELRSNTIDSQDGFSDAQNDVHTVDNSTSFRKVVSQQDTAFPRSVPAKAFIDCNIRLLAFPDTEAALTAGQMDVYLLFATPAS